MRQVYITTALLAMMAIAAGRLGLSAEPQPQPSTNSALIAQLKAARTKAVGQPLILNNKQLCGPTGDSNISNMVALDTNKNRTDEPADASVVTVSWNDLKNLGASVVPDVQGAPVRVVGYLSHEIHVESGSSGESANCHLKQPNEVDWHMYLTAQPNQGIVDAIIVETTPRVRPHHKWTTQLLQPQVNSRTQVRVTGWLLYDLEHLDVVGKERATVWEVHPVTRFEIQNANGQWADVEAMGASSGRR